jgi:hypothetical protein
VEAQEVRAREETAALIAVQAAAQARAEESSRKEREKASIRQDPSRYLESSDLEYFDKGILNDYRQLTRISILNKSNYALRNIAGEVDWVNGEGEKVGSVPFTVKGSIPAGDTKRFSKDAHTLQNGTLQTSAKRARIRFTQAEIVEVPE